jgi:hypothetical protein
VIEHPACAVRVRNRRNARSPKGEINALSKSPCCRQYRHGSNEYKSFHVARALARQGYTRVPSVRRVYNNVFHFQFPSLSPVCRRWVSRSKLV